MLFKNYVKNLTISENFKTQILNEDFKKNNPFFYQNYCSLFAQPFAVKREEVDYLDIAGYLYYHATLLSDSLLDEGELSQFSLITICQEESIKILTYIYGLEHHFWKSWNNRRNEYFHAIDLERKIFKKKHVSVEEYEILADSKSAFGKIAIDSLFSIDSKNENMYKQLLLSHKYFSIAFQLNDDIQDFREDLKNGQFNWAVYLLKQQDLENDDPYILEKYLYIRGEAKGIYLLGIDYCNKSLKVIENIDVPKWKEVIYNARKKFIIAIAEIDNYLKILNSEVKF